MLKSSFSLNMYNQLYNRPDSKANNPEPNDAQHSLPIELSKLIEKVDKLAECVHKLEIEMSTLTDQVYYHRI